MAKLRKVSGVTYYWNDLAASILDKNTEVREAGVLAQQIMDVLPEVVQQRTNGYMAVNYERLSALIIEAIKELADEVDALKKINNSNSQP